VRIPGHTGRIPGSYLHDMFQSWHSGFVAMTQLKNYMSQPCLTVGIYNIFKFFKNISPDGSKRSVFCRQISQKKLLTKCSRFHFVKFSFEVVHCHRVHSSAPEISSPLSYGRIFVVDYNLQFLLLLLLPTSIFKLLFVFIGCTASALDGSSPRGYSRKFSGIGSKYNIVA
jgi:hypothetical protein